MKDTLIEGDSLLCEIREPVLVFISGCGLFKLYRNDFANTVRVLWDLSVVINVG